MSTRLARSAGLIGAATMTSRVLGVARETVLAALFGAGNDMDAFNVAFRVPNLLRDLFAEGAMSAAFVPQWQNVSGTTRSSRGPNKPSPSTFSRRKVRFEPNWHSSIATASCGARGC